MAALKDYPGLIAVADEMNSRWASFIASHDGYLPHHTWPSFRTPFERLGAGELLVFGHGNDEKCGGVNRGSPVGVRTITEREMQQCLFWWDRMELSQGVGQRGRARMVLKELWV